MINGKILLSTHIVQCTIYIHFVSISQFSLLKKMQDW